ncbi:hypothetical protein [Hyphomonas sp.]|uniref:hypothetical protein n=1 Tax=Hyphomonas sp. TaxID=87 RepID=UPI00391DF431
MPERLYRLLPGLLLFVTACQPLPGSQPVTAILEPAPVGGAPDPAPPYIFTAAWDGRPEGAEWTRLTLAALDRHGEALLSRVPDDIADFCPPYPGLDREARKQVWLMLMSALARYESNHRTDVQFQESFNDSQGNPVISRGLLQISIESGRGYRCVIPEAEALHDADVNLSCGVRILNRWTGERDGLVASRVTPTGAGDNGWRGAARYWSPFRDAAKRSSMESSVRALPMCGE